MIEQRLSAYLRACAADQLRLPQRLVPHLGVPDDLRPLPRQRGDAERSLFSAELVARLVARA